jgi:DNA polymerase-3 subunit delta
MVAIKAHQADRYLASPPDGIRMFLLYGSDPGAITERVRMLERTGLQRGGNGAVIRIGSDELASNPGRIADEAFAISLFGGEPVIALRVLDGRHNVVGSLEALFERPPDAAWVVVEAGELTQANPLRKAFEASPAAAALPAYPLEGAGLASFIHAAADEGGVTIEAAAAEMLAEALGGDRLAARGELEKLFVYVGGHRAITPADVEAIVGETSEARTDEVIDAALTGESEALEVGLERMRAEAASPSGLAVLALRHVIQLQSLRLTMDSGATASASLDRARPPVFSRRRSAVEAALRLWPTEKLRDARRRIDRAIALSRLQPALENAVISDALHQIALQSRRLRRDASDPD